MGPVFSLSENFFDRLTEVKEDGKTSNLHSSAYADTVEGKLRSKSKRLALQGVSDILGYIFAQTRRSPRLASKPGKEIIFEACFDGWRLI